MLSPLEAAQAVINAVWPFVHYCRMLIGLLKVVKPDCKLLVIKEFISDPQALRRRWMYEQAFQINLRRRWTQTRT